MKNNLMFEYPKKPKPMRKIKLNQSKIEIRGNSKLNISKQGFVLDIVLGGLVEWVVSLELMMRVKCVWGLAVGVLELFMGFILHFDVSYFLLDLSENKNRIPTLPMKQESDYSESNVEQGRNNKTLRNRKIKLRNTPSKSTSVNSF